MSRSDYIAALLIGALSLAQAVFVRPSAGLAVALLLTAVYIGAGFAYGALLDYRRRSARPGATSRHSASRAR